MNHTQPLANAGIDYPAGLDRLMGDEGLYRMVLTAFMEDTVLERAEKALAEKDYKGLFHCAHEMKGASGNAGMTALNQVSCELVELLRGGNAERNAVANTFTRFKATYLRTKAGVREFLGSN